MIKLQEEQLFTEKNSKVRLILSYDEEYKLIHILFIMVSYDSLYSVTSNSTLSIIFLIFSMFTVCG